MRPFLAISFVLAFVVASRVDAQTAPLSGAASPQTARQALIEMFFGDAPDHLEKHLPDVTRRTVEKFKGGNGQNVPGIFSMLSAQSKAGKEKLQTFDTGPKLFTVEGAGGLNFEKTYATVERDEMVGDEDQIEVALHVVRNGKEEPLLSRILHFLFSMKMESGVWCLNEVSATARFPIGDPVFLREVEGYQLRQNEQTAQWSVRAVVNAEKSYQTVEGEFACTLSALGNNSKRAGASRPHPYLYDSQLAGGKKNGYRFDISACDATHYRILAEPEAPDTGQRAFCSDESGTLRASADGRGATCLASGEVIEDKPPFGATTQAIPPNNSASGTALPSRIRVSQGVAEGLIVSKVQPVYPPIAQQSRIQGKVVLKAVINETGDVVTLESISGHPMLVPAAMEAVKQWKYKPYLLNGKAVNVETQVTVNFALADE